MHPKLFLIGKLNEIGFEPWLRRPFCHVLGNKHAGQLV